MNSLKNKISLALILTLVVILSALMGYTYAVSDTPINVDGQQQQSTGQGNPAPGYIKDQDLFSRYDLLCCERGVHLPGDDDVIFSDGGRSGNFGNLTASDVGKKIFETGWTTSPSNPYKGGTSETYAYYKTVARHVCTPAEAWIIAEMINNNGYPAEVQLAWWATMFGSGGPTPTINTDLENEANAFEAYIAQVASTDPSTFVDTSYTYTVGGQTVSGTVPAPDIKYEPKWNEDANQDGEVNSHDEVTVSWNNDIQRYVIGPFSINYVEAKGKFGSREEVMFAGITHAKLFTDLGELKGSQWDFEWTDLGREDSDYPHPNEVFYIDMDYIPEAKYFKNLHFDFIYMNAGAYVDKLEGQYLRLKWSPKHDSKEVTDDEGETTTYYKYWDELTSAIAYPAQTLAYGAVGARWNNPAELDWTGEEEFEPNKGTLVLKKVVLDENGQEVTRSDGAQFTFRVTIDGKVSTIKLRAGQSWSTSRTWEHDAAAPTYSVEEIDIPEGYTLVGIDNPSGSFANKQTIRVKAINKAEVHEGKLKIQKKVTEPAEQDEVYKFNVYIGDKLFKTVTLVVPQGQNFAEETITGITWTGLTAPSYRVEEVEVPSFVRNIKYENQTGQISDSSVMTVTAINDTTPNHATIRIIKKVTDKSEVDEVYKFLLKVDGYEDEIVTITLPAGASESTEFYKEYKWRGGEKNYSIEEIEIPSFVKDVKYENQSGKLSDGTTANVTATNVISRDLHSRIKIYKTVSQPATQDEVYKFRVHVDGFQDEIVTILVPQGATTGNTVTTQEYTWKSDETAPHYKIEEVEIPLGYIVTYTGQEGQLISDTVAETTVSAYNAKQTPKKGVIEIKKVVEGGTSVNPNADFTIKVKITRADGTEQFITQKVKANNSVIIEQAWQFNEEAPKYKVEEIDIPVDYKLISIDNAEGSFAEGQSINVVCKNEGKQKGSIQIIKEVDGKLDVNELFTFKVTITNPNGSTQELVRSLKAGQYWTISKTWYKTDGAPTYKVEEINIPDGYTLKEIQNGEGSFAENQVARVTGINYGFEEGRLRITKRLENTTDTETVFTFRVTIGDQEQIVTLRAGYSWESELISWNKGKEAPTYNVEEINIPQGYELVGITNSTGKLAANEVKVAIATNKSNENHHGNISVTKHVIIDDKVKEDAIEGKFTVKVTISGTYDVNGEQITGSKVFEGKIGPNETFTTPDISWVGKTAPTFKVAETDLPEGWTFDSITNSTGILEEDTTTEIIVTNRFKSYIEYELTMEMGGIVWHDTPLNELDKNTPDSYPNGIYDQGTEEGIEKVEVRIFRYLTDENGNNPQLTGPAIAYDENDAPITWPIYTNADGSWSVPKVEITALKEGESGVVKYGVEFGYDGQTYEPTEFLVTGNGNPNAYKQASRAERNKFLFDSHADETEADRAAFNAKFTEITGDEAMQEDFTTHGYTIGSESVSLDYVAHDSQQFNGGATRKESTLVTRDEQGYILPQYIIKASTKTAGLVYPFDSNIHLLNIDKTLVTSGDKIGLHKKYNYSATYPYIQSINLGLVSRKEAELATTKDVYSATVVIDQKMMKYKYNELVDFEDERYSDYLNLQTAVENAGVGYTLDLFKTDYYYRAAIYNGSQVGTSLENFYKSLGYSDLAKELNLDVYVTYKISLFNDSDGYYASVNEIADYYDDDYELVDVNVDRYIQQANGVSVNKVTNIAESSFYKKAGAQANGNTIAWSESENKNGVSWTQTGSMVGSDGTLYHRMTTSSFKGEMLAPNERINVYVTFRVKNDAFDIEGYGIGNCLRMGDKANIAEISNYSTYNSADRSDIAGKVDRDSAPNNINITSHNEKSWYEDDTDSAPRITLTLYTINREINGTAWEDRETADVQYGQKVGNGKLDNNETGIADLTTELWEKVRVKNVDAAGNVETDGNGNPIYTDYDFLWPEDYIIEGSGHTLREVTGFDSTIRTDENGNYGFTGVPTGNYVVKFKYGDIDSTHAVQPGQGVKTADYDHDQIPAIYNGQDFKSSTYQADFEAINTDGNEYVNNEWHDLENSSLANERVNDARDNEARRLEITAKSRILVNENTSIMNTANALDKDHTQLLNDYYMVAETAKINLNIENMPSLKHQQVTVVDPETGDTQVIPAGEEVDIGGMTINYVKGKVKTNGGSSTDALDFTYTVRNIDFGLEERSETVVQLDKEIESIRVLNNTGLPILIADYIIEYDTTYDVNTGKASIKPKVRLNPETAYGTDNLQALNKDEERGIQNFRYINYDTSMAQSLTLSVTYKFNIFNLGEVDRIGYLYEERFDNPDTIRDLAAKVGEQRYTLVNGNYEKTPNADGNRYGDIYGWYLGRVYYKGNKLSQNAMNQDKIVETRVDQLIDYIDNDGGFEQANNTGVNASWKPTTIEELYENKVLSEDVYTVGTDGVRRIYDSKETSYETNLQSNIILSLDEKVDMTQDTMNNRDFVVRTVPYAIEATNANVDNKVYTTGLKMVMSRSIDSQINDDNAAFDNVAEIVRLDNTAGRRDVRTVAGNIAPKLGEFDQGAEERDGSATELITFSPPTGLSERQQYNLTIAIGCLIGMTILVVGIVLIKKKVLEEK